MVVRIHSLVSEPGLWRVYLRAEPGWWTYNAGRDRKWAVMSVAAEDDLGTMYLGQFDGARGYGDHEEVTLRFLPRLNPLARSLTLTFTGSAERVTLELRLPGPDEQRLSQVSRSSPTHSPKPSCGGWCP